MHETARAFAILLSDGSVVLCTPDNEHQDLFLPFQTAMEP